MPRLHNFLFIDRLTAVTLPPQAAGPSPLAGHPPIDAWTWTLFGGSCTETFQYRPNRMLLGTSGQEVVEKNYDVGAITGAQGFYKVGELVLRENDKMGCSGAQLVRPGEQSTRFVQFSPARDKLLMCQSASLAACFGPPTRAD